MRMIDVQNLTYKYNRHSPIVLDNINFSCEQGTVNVLIGLNGCGKTTLIKLIVGFFENYHGNILLKNKNIKELTIKERSKIMAYVPQRSGVIDDFLIKDYLLLGKANQLNFYQSPTIQDEKNLVQYVEQFNITHLLDKKLGEISGEERQIVSICGAMIQETELVVLDEPTSALDIKNQQMVLALLKEIARLKGKTFILSSHNPNHALYLNSNVALLRNGKIADHGTANNIITIEKLQQIYGNDICYSKDLCYKEISFKG